MLRAKKQATRTASGPEFLSLPPEIRQTILLYTYPSDHEELLILLRLRDSALEIYNPWLLWWQAYKKTKTWTAQLSSLDEVIKDDLVFVEKGRCKMLDTIWQTITDRIVGDIQMERRQLREIVAALDNGVVQGQAGWYERVRRNDERTDWLLMSIEELLPEKSRLSEKYLTELDGVLFGEMEQRLESICARYDEMPSIFEMNES